MHSNWIIVLLRNSCGFRWGKSFINLNFIDIESKMLNWKIIHSEWHMQFYNYISMHVGVCCVCVCMHLYEWKFITIYNEKKWAEERKKIKEQWREWLCNYFQILYWNHTFSCNQNVIIKNVLFSKPQFFAIKCVAIIYTHDYGMFPTKCYYFDDSFNSFCFVHFSCSVQFCGVKGQYHPWT